MKKVIVGISGGVDSAVSAYLLKKQGYQVEGVFMKNWEEQKNIYCSSAKDLMDAHRACVHLNIKLHVVDFVKEYWDHVFTYFLSELKKGVTPNPDILCNTKIKFNYFLQHAKKLKADFMATGHYAQIKIIDNSYYLHTAEDKNKDQTYFLHGLNQSQLKNTLYPLGTYKKQKVREIARKIGLKNAQKPDSTGICFIGERKFKSFIEQYLPNQPGDIITTDKQKIGTHDGLMYYTLGQRQGLNIGGSKEGSGKPWYVAKKLLDKNQLLVVQGNDHPSLYNSNLIAKEIHWINPVSPSLPFTCKAKIRYRQQEQSCIINTDKSQNIIVKFKTPQRAITPGQYIVFYKNKHCLGGAVINKTIQGPEDTINEYL